MSTMSPVLKRRAARPQKIRQYGFIEATHRKQFDDLARLAVMICRTPAAFIALEESGRYRIVAQAGPEISSIDHTVAFCRRVTEAREWTVAGPDESWMAGVPLLGQDGRTVGCLCVADPAALRIWSLSSKSFAKAGLPVTS